MVTLNILERYSTYIFDLDDTLYDQRNYLAQTLRPYLAQELPDKSDVQRIEIMNDYFTEYELRGPSQIIQRLNARLGTQLSVENFKSMLNNPHVDRRIGINPDMLNILNALKSMEKKIWVCTNGTRQQQQIKISLLSKHFDFNARVMYAVDTELKPSGASIKEVLDPTSYKDAIMIGDSEVDKIAAESVPIDFLYGWIFADLVHNELGNH